MLILHSLDICSALCTSKAHRTHAGARILLANTCFLLNRIVVFRRLSVDESVLAYMTEQDMPQFVGGGKAFSRVWRVLIYKKGTTNTLPL